MSRGDLTEAEWRNLKDLLPIEHQNHGRGRPLANRTVQSSTAYSGAHVSAAGGKGGGLIDALLAARGAASPVRCTARPMPCLPTRAMMPAPSAADLAKRNIDPAIPGRSNRRVKIEYDRALYKRRNRIDACFERNSWPVRTTIRTASTMSAIARGGRPCRHPNACKTRPSCIHVRSGWPC